MTPEQFVKLYPVVFHMAEDGAWPTIQKLGLLSTTALLDLFEVVGDEREQIESQRRPQLVELSHPKHGRATVRDNKPLREQFLKLCLDEMEPEGWYRLLNRKVFFWVRAERLATLLGARAYRSRPHHVMTFDTELLLRAREADVSLAGLNTGATLYPSAPRRGVDTFKSIQEYDYDAMVKRRGKRDAVVEMTIDYALRGVEQFTLKVERCVPGVNGRTVLWERL